VGAFKGAGGTQHGYVATQPDEPGVDFFRPRHNCPCHPLPNLTDSPECLIIRQMTRPIRAGKRGAVVIRAPLRRRYGIEEGSLVVAEARPEGVRIRPCRHRADRDLHA